jgi:hypothetical protein
MKRTASILTGLSLAVLSFVASAHAQYNQRMTANIPFEFTTGNTSLPAGQYDFLRTGDNILQVRDRNGRSVFTMASASVQANQLPEKSMLKFVIVDGRHVLIQIWNERTSMGYEFVDRQSSLELARRAAIHVPSQTAN